jgi:hypothetical protein
MTEDGSTRALQLPIPAEGGAERKLSDALSKPLIKAYRAR